jgi:hypothetical protein
MNQQMVTNHSPHEDWCVGCMLGVAFGTRDVVGISILLPSGASLQDHANEACLRRIWNLPG